MEKTELAKIENKVRQQLFGLVSLVVVGLMLLNSMGLLVHFGYAADDQTNMTFNSTTGAFSLSGAPVSMDFATKVYGQSGQMSGNEDVDGPRVTDYRGTSAAWSVADNTMNFTDGTDQIPASRLRLYQDVRGYLTNIENATTSRVTLGSNGTLNDGGVTLINTTSSPGIVQFDNGFVNLTYWATDAQGSYFTTMYYTLS